MAPKDKEGVLDPIRKHDRLNLFLPKGEFGVRVEREDAQLPSSKIQHYMEEAVELP